MQFETVLILAQAIPTNTSFLGWMLTALSTPTTVLVLVTAVLIFVGAYRLVSTKRPPSSLAAYLIILPLPIIISVSGWIYGSIASLSAIASSSELVITNQGIAGGLASSLLSILFAMMVSLPTYVALAYGLLSPEFRIPMQGNQTIKDTLKTLAPTSSASNATSAPGY